MRDRLEQAFGRLRTPHDKASVAAAVTLELAAILAMAVSAALAATHWMESAIWATALAIPAVTYLAVYAIARRRS